MESIKNFITKCKDNIYMDYNASTPVLQEVLSDMQPFFTKCFYNMKNPYSAVIANYVEEIRLDIIRKLGSTTGKIVFYSGATEALNSILTGVVLNSLFKGEKGKNIVVSAVEHDAVIVCAKSMVNFGIDVRICPVNKQGVVILENLSDLVDKDTLLVSIMHVNNETGVIQPIEKISQICREKSVLFHSDGVTAVGRVDISSITNYVDYYTISAYKFYGPRGVGLNYFSGSDNIIPLIRGSSQEYVLRAGTQDVPCIIGLHKALKISLFDYEIINSHEKKLRDSFKDRLLEISPSSRVNGEGASIVNNTLNVSFKGFSRHYILEKLIENNILANVGATYLNENSSHVIEAMYQDEDYVSSSIRFSLGRFSTENDIDKTIEVLDRILNKS